MFNGDCLRPLELLLSKFASVCLLFTPRTIIRSMDIIPSVLAGSRRKLSLLTFPPANMPRRARQARNPEKNVILFSYSTKLSSCSFPARISSYRGTRGVISPRRTDCPVVMPSHCKCSSSPHCTITPQVFNIPTCSVYPLPVRHASRPDPVLVITDARCGELEAGPAARSSRIG